jgi:hypothetical protein
MRGRITVVGGVWTAFVLLGCGASKGGPAHSPQLGSPPPVEIARRSDARVELDVAELERLARAREPEGIALAVDALGREEPALRLLGARALVAYGPAAHDASARLSQLLPKEPPGELAGTVGWALLELELESSADDVLRRLTDGSLQLARHLDGTPAFDVTRLRQYGARFKGEKALHEHYLTALGNALGGAEVVAELPRVSTEPKAAFFEQTRIFDVLARLNDPGAADALYGFAKGKPHVHFETRAAHALAMIGDLRAAPLLARRLRLNPLTVYSPEVEWEVTLRRDDSERVVSARLLADLATIHPSAHAQLLRDTESALLAWLNQMPWPNANGMRALATMGSRRGLAQLRRWANPNLRLPLEDVQPPLPEEWVIAQTALRYVGMLRDGPSRPVLRRALQRRPRELDATMEGLMQGGVAILGMALRAIGVGAAQGLAEWRDASAFQPLLRYVEDPLNNEQARFMACTALAWTGTDQDLQQLARRAVHPSPADEQNVIFRECALAALHVRPVPNVSTIVLPLLAVDVEPALRHVAAKVIGRSPIDSATEQRLMRLLTRPELRDDAALALMLGGTPKAAAAAFSSHAQLSGGNLNELLGRWHSGFESWLREDVANGSLFRYVENVEAIGALTPRDLAREPEQILRRQLAALVYDTGPHSATRPVLLHQLRQVVAHDEESRAERALDTLVLLEEVGTLSHLARTAPRAAAARAAHQKALAWEPDDS